MISEQTQQLLNSIAEKHGRILFVDVKAVLEKLRRSGQLVESAQLTIIKATSTEPPKILITYADQGFFISQRQPQWTKQPDVKNLKEWSSSVDFNGPVPGYKNGVAPNLPPWKVKERIVWAIAKSKHKFDTHKRIPWKKKAKIGDLLKQLNEDTLQLFSKEIEQVLTQALEATS